MESVQCIVMFIGKKRVSIPYHRRFVRQIIKALLRGQIISITFSAVLLIPPWTISDKDEKEMVMLIVIGREKDTACVPR